MIPGLQLLWTQNLMTATPPQNPNQHQQRQLNRRITMVWRNGNASLEKQQESFKLDKDLLYYHTLVIDDDPA